MTLGVCLAVPAFAITNARTVPAAYSNHVVQVHMDSDAYAFCQRANITNDLLTIGAVQRMVFELKTNNLWTNFYGLYPMVGGTSNACAQNLCGNSNNIVFGTNWLWNSMGVSNKGVLGGTADTGFNCTNFASSQMHVYGWIATNGMTTSALLFQGDDGNSTQIEIKLTEFDTACGPDGATSAATVAATYGGNIISILGGSFSGIITAAGASAKTDSDPLSPCSPVINGNLKFGTFGTAPKCTYRAVSFGNPMTVAQAQTYFAIMNRFQQALGRGNQ